MNITITIPDEIATPADTYVRSLRAQPKPDPNGPGDILLPLYPDGLQDWIDEVIAQNLIRIPSVSTAPAIRTQQQLIEKANKDMLNVLKPKRTAPPST